MRLTSDIEDEVDAIRDQIYEEIKDMTPEEETAFIKAQTESIHEEYGIRTVEGIKEDKLVSA